MLSNQDGFTGSKCNQCLDNYFMSIEGCSYCNCSGRTMSCTQHPNVTDVSFEFCNCPAEYRGDSCQVCMRLTIICMYVCMYVCIYICMYYVCMYVHTLIRIHLSIYLSL